MQKVTFEQNTKSVQLYLINFNTIYCWLRDHYSNIQWLIMVENTKFRRLHIQTLFVQGKPVIHLSKIMA